jgi:hypothetical protein
MVSIGVTLLALVLTAALPRQHLAEDKAAAPIRGGRLRCYAVRSVLYGLRSLTVFSSARPSPATGWLAGCHRFR